MLVTSTRPGVLPSGDDRPMAMRVAALAQFLVSSGRQVFCALRGHEMMLHFESDRLSLRCLACGAETPGWRLDVNPALRIHPRRVVIRAIVRSDTAGSRSVGDRHESDAGSPKPRAA
jgi:hypothetical protein